MFLDDELLEIGRKADLSTYTSVNSACQKMLQVCFGNLVKNIEKDFSLISANFKRVNKTWVKVARLLSSEGKGFVNEDGFRLFVEATPGFKGIKLD